LQKEQQNFVTKMSFWTKGKNTTTKKKQKKIKHKNPCRRPELNPGPLEAKADALPLHHRIN